VFLCAKNRLLKFQMQVFAQIGSALGSTAPSPALPEHVAKSKNVAKDIAEILEDCGIESRRATARTAKPGVSKAVIQRSLLTVGQNRVSLGDLLELIFRLRIIGISVRMVRHRKLAIGALYFDFRGSASDTQHLIKIAFCIGGQNSPTSN